MTLTIEQKKAAILDTLLQAAKDEAAIAAAQNDDYHIGETMGWYRILSIALDEAEAYGVPRADIGMEGYNPDNLLTMNQRNKQAA